MKPVRCVIGETQAKCHPDCISSSRHKQGELSTVEVTPGAQHGGEEECGHVHEAVRVEKPERCATA